jgi:hypothetical protein
MLFQVTSRHHKKRVSKRYNKPSSRKALIIRFMNGEKRAHVCWLPTAGTDRIIYTCMASVVKYLKWNALKNVKIYTENLNDGCCYMFRFFTPIIRELLYVFY